MTEFHSLIVAGSNRPSADELFQLETSVDRNPFWRLVHIVILSIERSTRYVIKSFLKKPRRRNGRRGWEVYECSHEKDGENVSIALWVGQFCGRLKTSVVERRLAEHPSDLFTAFDANVYNRVK